MKLITINLEGIPVSPIEDLPEIANDVLQSTAERYKTEGHQFPWVGYLVLENEKCVGTCAFKTAPVDGRVEIAYFTFPGNESMGIATRMTERLIKVTMHEAPEVIIIAQTLPTQNASTRVLEKHGFRKASVVEHPIDGTVWEWELK